MKRRRPSIPRKVLPKFRVFHFLSLFVSCPHLSLIRNTRRPQKRQRRPQRQRRRRDDFPTMELLARQKASLSLSSSSSTTTITTPTCRLGRRLRRQPLSRRRVETSSFTSSSETSSCVVEGYRRGEVVDGTTAIHVYRHAECKSVRQGTHRETTSADGERAVRGKAKIRWRVLRVK